MPPEPTRQTAVEKLWALYERADPQPDSTDFIGALWGLIDLGEAGIADALFLDLLEGREYYELFGFLALAGDERVVVRLLMMATQLKDDSELDDPMLALVGIAHRIGREALLVELMKAASEEGNPAELEKLADGILSIPISAVKEYFELFSLGVEPQDIESLSDDFDL